MEEEEQGAAVEAQAQSEAEDESEEMEAYVSLALDRVHQDLDILLAGNSLPDSKLVPLAWRFFWAMKGRGLAMRLREGQDVTLESGRV